MLAWLVPGGPLLGAAGGALSAFIRFATSTVGMILLALLIGYGAGHHQAKKACDAANLRAKIEAMRADLTTAQNAASLAQKQADALDETNRANEDRVNELSNDIAKRNRPVSGKPTRDCGLSRGDALRLRNIR